MWRRRRTLKCKSYRLSNLITRLHASPLLKVESGRLKVSPLEHPSYAYSLRTNLVRILTYRDVYQRSSWCNYRQLQYPLVGSAIRALRSPLLLFGYWALAVLITVNNSAASLARAVTRICSSRVLLNGMSSWSLAASRSANISKLFSLAVILRSLVIRWFS